MLFVHNNINKAIYYLTLAAKQHKQDSQILILHEGLHVTYDIDKAIHHFKEASCLNHPCAKNNL